MQESFFEKTIIDQQHLIAYASDPDKIGRAHV